LRPPKAWCARPPGEDAIGEGGLVEDRLPFVDEQLAGAEGRADNAIRVDLLILDDWGPTRQDDRRDRMTDATG
jgi:hypothetical protein